MSDKSPYLPERDLKVERAIGRFIVAWGSLEREIDSAIHDLLLTSRSTGMAVTANLAIRGKLDLVHALFEKLRSGPDALWHPISEEWEKRFDDLVNMTAKANSDSRIPLVHSQPTRMQLDSVDQAFWIKPAARKGGWRGSGVSYTKKYLDKRTDTVVKLLNEWALARAHWKRGIEAMRSADADEWLNRSPDSQDHLTLQLQPIRDSQKATPKQKPRKKPPRRG